MGGAVESEATPTVSTSCLVEHSSSHFQYSLALMKTPRTKNLIPMTVTFDTQNKGSTCCSPHLTSLNVTRSRYGPAPPPKVRTSRIHFSNAFMNMHGWTPRASQCSFTHTASPPPARITALPLDLCLRIGYCLCLQPSSDPRVHGHHVAAARPEAPPRPLH